MGMLFVVQRIGIKFGSRPILCFGRTQDLRNGNALPSRRFAFICSGHGSAAITIGENSTPMGYGKGYLGIDTELHVVPRQSIKDT